MLTHLRNAWLLSSIASKVAVLAVIVIVIALAVGATHRMVSHYKDRQADKAIAAEHAKSEEHRQRADEAEAQAKLLELTVKAAGQKVEAIAAKVTDEDKRYQDEQTAIGADVDLCERLKRACARLQLPPAQCPCSN